VSPAQKKIKIYRESPKKFFAEELKMSLDPWQEDAADALASSVYIPRRRLCAKAATGVGKSAFMAGVGWWRLSCFGTKGEHPKGAAISGEGRDNLRDNLWAELAKWQSRSEFLKHAFTWTKEQIYANDHPETWFLSARGYPKDANSETVGQSLSGLHSNFPFVLLDETGGMPPIVGQRAEQVFTGGVVDGLIAQAGNPTSMTGLLYATCNNPGDTIVITITADPDDPKRSSRVDAEHARQMIEKYGRDNPWVMATILGLFPKGTINTLLSLEDVEKSMARHYQEPEFMYASKRLGIDCARFGMDATFLAPRQGLVAFNPVEMRGARSDEVAARAVLAKHNWSKGVEVLIFVDGTGGYGSGVIDSMVRANEAPHEVHFSGKAQDPRFLNTRAEMWFRMAKWVKRGGKLPNKQELIKQFTTPTYFFQNGKFQLEPKEQIKKRLGYSTDYGDALGLTFYLEESPATYASPQNLSNPDRNFQSDWDPLDEV
jgi:phage terminase large subunit